MNRLALLLNPPPPSAEQRKIKRQEAEWKRRADALSRKEADNREQWRRDLTERLEQVRDPGFADPTAISQAQHYLHERMREKGERSSTWSSGEWGILKEEFGDAVALAFRDAAKGYWRRYRPQLASEAELR